MPKMPRTQLLAASQHMNRLIRMLTYLFICGWMLLATLIVASNLVMLANSKQQGHDSSVINTSGRQRMLSERLRSIATGIAFDVARNPAMSASEFSAVVRPQAQQLLDSVDRWLSVHEALRSGNDTLGVIDPPFDDETRRLYEVIESSLSDVVASCYALLTALDLPGAGARLNASALFAYTDHIRHEQPVFAAGMEDLVMRYDDLSSAKVRRAQLIIYLVLAAALSTLVFEALAVFRPALGLIRSTFNDLQLEGFLLIESNQQLGNAKSKAQHEAEANQAKTAFLATMSHELRTPLHGILGLTQLLASEVPAELQSDFNTVVAMGQQMLNLVNDLLDISALEIGELRLDRELVDIHRIVRDTQATVEAALSSARVTLRCEVADGTADGVGGGGGGGGPYVGAARRIGQILLNLVCNAVKFSPPNSTVVVRAAIATSPPRRFHEQLPVISSIAGQYVAKGPPPAKQIEQPASPGGFSRVIVRDIPGAGGRALLSATVTGGAAGRGSSDSSSGDEAATTPGAWHTVEPSADAGGDGLYLVCEVQDNGPGISEADMSRLFQAFSQLDAGANRKFQGSGLGLAICRRLALLMHGDVWATSTVGVGSTFSFFVRLEKGPLHNTPSAHYDRVLLEEHHLAVPGGGSGGGSGVPAGSAYEGRLSSEALLPPEPSASLSSFSHSAGSTHDAAAGSAFVGVSVSGGGGERQPDRSGREARRGLRRAESSPEDSFLELAPPLSHQTSVSADRATQLLALDSGVGAGVGVGVGGLSDVKRGHSPAGSGGPAPPRSASRAALAAAAAGAFTPGYTRSGSPGAMLNAGAGAGMTAGGLVSSASADGVAGAAADRVTLPGSGSFSPRSDGSRSPTPSAGDNGSGKDSGTATVSGGASVGVGAGTGSGQSQVYVPGQPRDSPPSTAGGDRKAAVPRFIIADDAKFNRDITVRMLKVLVKNCECHLAEDGLQALNAFQDFGGSITAVFMDAHMPKLDGLEATRRIRELERSRGTGPVPIIAVTADASTHMQQQCKLAGVDQFIPKPFGLPELRTALQAQTQAIA